MEIIIHFHGKFIKNPAPVIGLSSHVADSQGKWPDEAEPPEG